MEDEDEDVGDGVDEVTVKIDGAEAEVTAVGVDPGMVTAAADTGTVIVTGAETGADVGTVDTAASTGVVVGTGAEVTGVGESGTAGGLVVVTEKSFWRPGTVLASWATAAANVLSVEAAVTFWAWVITLFAEASAAAAAAAAASVAC